MMTSLNHDDFAHLRIPLADVTTATNNFARKNIIGKDNFGNYYKGQLLWSGELIKIDARRFNKDEWVEKSGFSCWVSMLSSLKHKNVVSLVGFCDENDEKIIITKLETRACLDNYLSDPMLLTWVRRLEICVGVARALSYLHYDEPRDFSVIHRLISSSRVLLNDDWEPKLCDFECSMKIKASQRHHSFHTNRLDYVEGYGDPTYIETKSVNHKSDMYSFGIVMFELLCGRKAVMFDQDNKYLASVAVTHYREKKLNKIIDWELRNQMDSQSFKIFVETAYDCLNEERSQRPNIDEIVTRLERALELQLEHQNAVDTTIRMGLQVGGVVSGQAPSSDMERESMSSGGWHSYSRDHSALSWNALSKPSISDMARENMSSGGWHSYSRDHSAPSWNALSKRDSSITNDD